jgi:hypothetical protein
LSRQRFECLGDQQLLVMRRNDGDDPAGTRVVRVGDVLRPGAAVSSDLALISDKRWAKRGIESAG